MENNQAVSVSVPVFGLLGLVLVILKLTGTQPVADWSWWIVTMPFWFGIVIFIAFFILFAMFAIGVAILAALFGR